MCKAVIRVQGSHTCARQSYVCKAVIRVQGSHTCARQSYMCKAVIHVQGSHTCARQSYMCKAVLHMYLCAVVLEGLINNNNVISIVSYTTVCLF